MHFTEIVKEVLLSQLVPRGFAVVEENKGLISFASGDFKLVCTYDYAFTKDFSLRVCCTLGRRAVKCMEDYELVQLLSYPTNAYQALSETEQIQKYARYYSNFFRERGDQVFNRNLFTVP